MNQASRCVAGLLNITGASVPGSGVDGSKYSASTATEPGALDEVSAGTGRSLAVPGLRACHGGGKLVSSALVGDLWGAGMRAALSRAPTMTTFR